METPYVIADNTLAENAGWDRDLLALELQELAELDLGFDLEVIGFRAGSPLAGRDLHPLDDESEVSWSHRTPPIPIDQQSLVALFLLCPGRAPTEVGGRLVRRPKRSAVRRAAQGV